MPDVAYPQEGFLGLFLNQSEKNQIDNIYLFNLCCSEKKEFTISNTAREIKANENTSHMNYTCVHL